MQLPFDGGRSGKVPVEKSNFSQTCSLLSRYLKAKGNPRDLSLEIRGKLEAAGKSDMSHATSTIDFLANMEKSSHTLEIDLNSADPIPNEQNDMGSSRPTMEETINEASTSKEAPRDLKNAPLTIFYAVKTILFDDFPADKARAVMLLASKVSSQQSSCGIFQTASADFQPSANSVDPPKRTISPAPPSPQVPLQPAGNNASDLPIARRSSLHRFLEKRKDRATARVPYQVHNPLSSSSKNEGSSSKNNELDLNFKL